jgi:hypothetical protein
LRAVWGGEKRHEVRRGGEVEENLRYPVQKGSWVVSPKRHEPDGGCDWAISVQLEYPLKGSRKISVERSDRK